MMIPRPGPVARGRVWLGSLLLAGAAAVLAYTIFVVSAPPAGAAQSGDRAARAVPATGSTSLVISQVYGGGGNSGALYTNDFVELFNPTNLPVTFTDWSVQYASATGGSWQVSVLTGTTTLAPGQYFLIQEARGAGGSQPLPTPDNVVSINMSATAGKVALVNNATALGCGSTCHNDSHVVDYVGYGTTANDYEGAGPAPAPSNTTSDMRVAGGCTDTDNNNLDFVNANPPTPRNTSSPLNPCPLAGTATATGTATIVGPTATPGGPTATDTATPGAGTATPTATSTPGGGTPAGVDLVMLYAYGLTTATPQPDEAVRLMNTTGLPAVVGGWQIRNQAGGTITLPITATLAPGQKIWVANTATQFHRFFGFNPDYEYGADSDPTVPQATASAGFMFADAGGSVQLLDQLATVQDALVYGTGNTSITGWSGPAVQYYSPPSQPGFVDSGQIFNRKLDEITGQPVPDTNTKDDWAQDDDPSGTATPGPNDRENDDVNGKKQLHPGWALTNPAYEDMFFTKKYTDTNVTTQFLVEPDNGYLPVHNLIVSATQSITIETYEWHAAPLVQDIIAAKNRGVQVNVIIDGNPCCNFLPDDETLWSAQQWEAAGIHVYFFSGTPATSNDTYRYNNTHAKIMVVDRQWVVTGPDNFSLGALTTDPRDNGTAGERGALVITNAPDVVAYTLRLIGFDFQPGNYADIVEYPALGTPSPGYAPTPFPDMTGYTPVKPTPLVVTETEAIEVIQAPDNALRDVDSLIGLVNQAGPGDELLVEQQYERTYWENSVTDGPNPRLQAYIRAAQRGANVRILLDGFFEGGDCSSTTHNPQTVAYVNGLGLPNLQAKVAAPTAGHPVGGPPTPTTGNIHNKMVLVTLGTHDWVHLTSVNGSANASKLNREYGLQIQSNAAYSYYRDVFNYDWSQGYLPCGQGTATPTATGTPPTATPTVVAATATPLPTPQCNLLVNGDFETGQQAPWVTTTPGVTATVVTNPVFDGLYAIAITHAFTATNGGSQGIEEDVPNIVAGGIYQVRGAVYRPDNNIQSARVRVAWYTCPDYSCSQLSTSDVFAGNRGMPGWQVFSGNVTAPAGAVAARYRAIFYNANPTASTIVFDALVLDCPGGAATPTASVTATVTAQPPTATATSSPLPSATSTATLTATSTAIPPSATLTATSTALPPSATLTATSTALPPSVTRTATSTPLPSATSTAVPSATSTPATTSTAVPPTGTATLAPSTTATPTRTSTTVPATATPLPPSATPAPSNTPLPSNTPMPSNTPPRTPTTAPTGTLAPPSATRTPLPPTATPAATGTPLPATGTPQPSATAAPPSATAPPTGTAPASATAVPASPTVTICAAGFDDVHPTDYFYTPVLYLACHGVISGYSDGTFRPYATTTRAQMVKIVGLGFGLSISTPPAGRYTFADVPPAQPFFPYVETAAAQQIVSGYTCGGPGEPCDAQQRPYFRPNANVTRGQLSKIVVVAAGWTLLNPPGPGTFEDVAPNSAFYPFVETAACHGIVSGYTCGGPGEPCDAQGRPYFRQFSNATRGQIAKIVYLAVTGPSACAAPTAGPGH